MSKTYQIPPSKLLKLKSRLKREDALDPEFICYCFDRAVVWAGNFVENYANKYDRKQHGDFDEYFNRLFEDNLLTEGRGLLHKLIGMFGLN
jgi:hypothetical protein